MVVGLDKLAANAKLSRLELLLRMNCVPFTVG